MEFLWFALAAIALGGILFAAIRRRDAGAAPPDASEAVRRDIARLIQELQTSVRAQVDRLDREVKRVQEAVAEAERALAALEDSRARQAPKPPAPPPPANPLHARIFELRDSGKEPADIGVETGLEVGEVELILGLRRMPPRA